MGERFDAVGMLDRLVGFDTTSHRSNLDLVRFVQDYLSGWGVEGRLTFDETGRKANLHALIGPAVAGGVALSGHTDCVPVEGQAWSGDPFRLRRTPDGRLVARGTCDMKGFVACALALVPEMLERGLTRPIHLCLSFDEETNMSGAPRMIAAFGQDAPPPAMCIVGEPTQMTPVVAHKGYASWDVAVTGLTGHSSRTHRTANALEAAAEAVAWLKGAARRFRDGGRRAEGLDPPWTTVHVGTFAAGTILNIVPDRADFAFEVRSVPGDEADAVLAGLQAHLEEHVLPELRAVAPQAGFAFSRRCLAPPLDLPEEHPLAGLTKRLSGRNDAAKVGYGTEAGLFQRAGIPTVVCGPGDVAQAHTADEWIAESELAACTAFLRRLLDHMATTTTTGGALAAAAD